MGSTPADDRQGEGTRSGGGNLVALVLGQLVTFASAVVVQAFLARVLGREVFGAYSFLLGVMALFSFVAHLNLGILLAREIARAPEQASDRLGLGLVTASASSLAAIAGVVAYVALRDGRPAMVAAAVVAGLALGVRGLQRVSAAVFQGMRQMRVMAAATAAGRLILLVTTVALVWLGTGLPGVFLAQVLGSAAALAYLVARFRRDHASIRLRHPGAAVAALAREARPFALNQLFAAVYLTSDVLVLKEFHGDEEIGLYRAASILVIQLPVIAIILNTGIYPKMARMLGDARAAGEEVSFELRVLLAMGLPIAVGGICVAEPLLVLIVGNGYMGAVPALIVLLAMVPVRFVNNTAGNVLSALDRQEARTRGVMFAALFNLAANLVVIPRWGAVGAAATTLATDSLLLAFQAWSMRGVVAGVSVVGPTVRAVLPCVPMAAVVLLVPEAHVLVRIALGVAVYVPVAFATGAVRRDDWPRLRAI